MITTNKHKFGRGDILTCALCGANCVRRSGMQKYCSTCSEVKSAERQRKWARENPPTKEYVARRLAAHRSRALIVGEQTSQNHASGMGVDLSRPITGEWIVRYSLPFSYSVSKNAIYSLGRGAGHLFRRQRANAYRDAIIVATKAALAGQRIYQNKIWIGLHIQKPNHKGDAVNVIDTVCDSLKVALGVDDRWFCIRRLDWEIVKKDPFLTIDLMQEDAFDAQSCHCCGRILSLDNFTKCKSNKMGVSRMCRDCTAGRIVDPPETRAA